MSKTLPTTNESDSAHVGRLDAARAELEGVAEPALRRAEFALLQVVGVHAAVSATRAALEAVREAVAIIERARTDARAGEQTLAAGRSDAARRWHFQVPHACAGKDNPLFWRCRGTRGDGSSVCCDGPTARDAQDAARRAALKLGGEVGP